MVSGCLSCHQDPCWYADTRNMFSFLRMNFAVGHEKSESDQWNNVFQVILPNFYLISSMQHILKMEGVLRASDAIMNAKRPRRWVWKRVGSKFVLWAAMWFVGGLWLLHGHRRLHDILLSVERIAITMFARVRVCCCML